jgi:hypothetical protein
MRFVRLGASAAVLLACGGALAQENSIGKLFFTPDRRAALEGQRQMDVQQARVIEGDKLSVDGVVKRSSGKSTVWINGVAHHDRTLASEVQPRISDRDPGRVVLQAGDRLPASLRVGESVNRATGKTDDPLGGGRIVSRPTKNDSDTDR